MRAVIAAIIVGLASAPAVRASECVPTRITSEVVITTHDGKRLKGVLVCADAEKAVFTSGHTTRSVPRSAIHAIVTTRDSVWNGFALGAVVGMLAVWMGSHEAHLRDGDSSASNVGVILTLGSVGALIDAAQHAGGRRVTLPDRDVRVVAWRVRF